MHSDITDIGYHFFMAGMGGNEKIWPSTAHQGCIEPVAVNYSEVLVGKGRIMSMGVNLENVAMLQAP